MQPILELAGRRYGHLTVIERAPNVGTTRNSMWFCKCDCDPKTILKIRGVYLTKKDGRTTCSVTCPLRTSTDIIDDTNTDKEPEIMPTAQRAPLSKIDPSPHHHRLNWGDMIGLAESIKTHDVIMPLAVRVIVEGRFEMISGERRRRAAEKAGLRDVPIVVKEGLSDAQVIAMQAAENLDRENLHPMDEAQYYADLADQGMSVDAIAKMFRQRKREILRSLKLLALAPPARKMFAAGGFDLGGALAIARVADPSKQRDILSAIEAGALQPEEIESHVERTYTHALADAAWRMDDERLVPAAGSCIGCPKRTGAQRDLFDDAQADRCLDVDCWGRKMAASYDLFAARVSEDGATGLVLYPGDAGSLFMPSGTRPPVLRASGFVDSEAACPHLSGRTWSEAISLASPTSPPTLHLARDLTGRPRTVYREAAVARIVRKSEAHALESAKRAESDPVREGVDGRAAARVRREIIERIAVLGVEKDVDSWAPVVRALIDVVFSKRVVALAAAQFEVMPDKLGAFIDSNRKAKQVMWALAVREIADTGGTEFPQALVDFAELCGTTIETQEAAEGAA